MKYLKILLILNLILFFGSCGTVKKAFSNQKKNSSDEFLIEKKSPLVMPPDYNDLPSPDTTESNLEENASEIENLLANDENSDSQNKNSDNSDKNFEESLIDKIKNN